MTAPIPITTAAIAAALGPANTIRAAAELGNLTANGLTAVSGVAYSGGPIQQWWSPVPLYIDLGGLAIRAQVPLLYNHYNSPNSRLGLLSASIVDNALTVSGGIDPAADGAQKLIAAGKKIPWQLSVGAQIDKLERIERGDRASVNGRSIEGPAAIARKATLTETSIVAVGADAQTHLSILASLNLEPTGEPPMPPTNPSIPAAATTEPAAQPVQAAQPAAPPAQAAQPAAPPAQAAQPAAPPAQAAPPAAPSADNASITAAAIAAERERVAAIDRICVRHPELAVRARNDGWDANRTREAVLDAINAAYQPAAPNIAVRNDSVNQHILQAAAYQAIGVPAESIEASLGRESLAAADRRWHGGIGLQELIIEAAQANGHPVNTHRLHRGNWHDVTQGAIRASGGIGVSPINLPGLLGGIVSRSLLEGYGVVDQSWQQIAAQRAVPDFREVISYRLSSDGGFAKVGPTGELKHGGLSETSYTNKAGTYGKMIGASREDIINDDLGALASINQQLGLDAGMKLNEIIWKEFLDNAEFFTLDAGNLVANNPLGIEGLAGALKAFRALKDESGRILGTTPSILLVPPSLEILASQLFKDQAVIAIGLGSSAKTIPASNPHTGKYTPVTSPYLEDVSLSGNSATAYYLLARPAFRAAIQVVFLNGVKVPTIESSEMVFDQLGIQFRAYFDFGAKKMDPRAGVKIQGNA
jgi:hypothetical protein